MAAAIELRQPVKPGRLVVVGNALWMSNGFFDVLGNSDFFFGILRWFEDAGETLPILSRARAHRLLFLTREQLSMLVLITCIGLPFLGVLCGCYLLIARRMG